MSNSKNGALNMRARMHAESGVTLLEMVIALLILTVGLLSVAGAISYSLAVSNRGRGITNAKYLITSMLEQIETARNAKDLTFGQISNTGSVDDTGGARVFAGFPTGFIQVSRNPGPDGIFGTGDDLLVAQPDGTYVTDNTLAIPGFTRQVQITFLGGNTNLKKIQVTLKYPGMNGKQEQLVGVSYLNNDARSNYLY
jgi:type II secretory pathway pseudopilin PulG